MMRVRVLFNKELVTLKFNVHKSTIVNFKQKYGSLFIIHVLIKVKNKNRLLLFSPDQ